MMPSHGEGSSPADHLRIEAHPGYQGPVAVPRGPAVEAAAVAEPKPVRPRLSVVLITRNEAHRIRDCLESVAFADQIVVVDSGSDDATVGICREFTDRVHVTDWPGFGPQKNRALDLAEGDWVLSLDADERVSDALREEILAATASPGDCVAYRVPRRTNYCGRWLRHGGCWPDRVLRLFRRGCARFSDDLVHERVLAEGRVGTLRTPLLHYSMPGFEEVLHKLNTYTTLSARMHYARGRRGSLAKAVLHGLTSFLRAYVFRGGFLDGGAGFMWAVCSAEGSYYRYLKLMLLAERETAGRGSWGEKAAA